MKKEDLGGAEHTKHTPVIQHELELCKMKCIKDMYTIAIRHTYLILADIDELLEGKSAILRDKKVLEFKTKIGVIVDASLEFYNSIRKKG